MKCQRVLWYSAIFFALVGCGSDQMDDLRQFVATAHADRKPKVDPLPEVKTNETYSYSAAELQDPFATFNLKPPGTATAGKGPRPDPNRRKEPLEDYPLDSLKMVGTLVQGRQAWAVIQAPDGTVHSARVGNHLGQNFGMITQVAEDKIEVVELVQGSLGDWTERQANLALSE